MKLEPFRLERYFAEHEFTAPYLLCSSDCETMELGELLSLEPWSRDSFSSLRLGYTESKGSSELRQCISALYEKVADENVLVHTGAEEAIFNFMNVALEPGDQVIVHAPCYQSLEEIARGIGTEVTEWRGNPERAWELDLDELKALITTRTKVVVVNFPHNPTGFFPDADFVHGLSALSDRHGFIIFSDEVYRGLELDPSERLPSLADVSEHAVALGVMSKTYGLAGLRIGWIATRNAKILDGMAEFKDYTTICSSAPSEFLAALALRHADMIANRNLLIIHSNLDRLDHFFRAHEELFAWNRPRAGSIAFPTLLRGQVDELCADLLQKKGVLLVPGTIYGPGYNSFRVGFGRKNMPEALERFNEYIYEKDL